MGLNEFFSSFLIIVNEMSPFLLLGFLIAGVLHVFVPKSFYRKYLSKDNKFSVLWAALLGIPLPLCSCGVIPTAIGLKNEKASDGAVASFLIATPQTGIDSILATFSLMGLGFAVLRPVAALVTGICGGILINRYAARKTADITCAAETNVNTANDKPDIMKRIKNVLHYAFVEMFQSIGLRLLVGLLLAALINVAVPDDFFLKFGSQPLLQMLVILIIAIPMYICSTGSIPIAAALIIKGLSPGAALVMLMAGPAVNLASILVVKKSLCGKFTLIYLSTIIIGSILFGFLTNALPLFNNTESLVNVHSTVASCCAPAENCCNAVQSCCNTETAADTHASLFNIICSVILVILIINAIVMNLFSKFKKPQISEGSAVYTVEGMNCSHCKAAVEKAAMNTHGVQTATADVAAKSLTVTGNPDEKQLKNNIEQAGFCFKGKRN